LSNSDSETRILVVAAHPDDETLGCGGTLLRHRAAGDRLYWARATEAHEPQWPAEVVRRKAAEVERVTQAYGLEERFDLGFPAAWLDTVPKAELMEEIGGVVEQVRPTTLYLVHGGDVHTDHREVFAAAMSVLKPVHMGRLGVRRVLCFETLSSTDAAPPAAATAFLPTVLCDITPHIDRKLEIMELYETEAQPDPSPRGPSAIRALARLRGAAAGVEYAEAFQLVRELV